MPAKSRIYLKLLKFLMKFSYERCACIHAFSRTIQKDMLNNGIVAEDMERMASRRADWRKFIAGLWAS